MPAMKIVRPLDARNRLCVCNGFVARLSLALISYL
jgi:hypothetical protein